MHHPQEHINQDTKRRQSKDMDPTVHKTDYQQQPKQQAPTIPTTDKSPNLNRHRV